jgi:glycosyltransferase involved in cell wall biosynthesis
MDYWRAIGKVVVIDLDDHYPHLPASNPAHVYWIVNRARLDPTPIDALAEGLRHADALISPSKVILQDWSHITDGFWVPNWPRGVWYEGVERKPDGAPDLMLQYVQQDNQHVLTSAARPDSVGQIILGWGGSISHVDSWLYSGALEALERIFEKHPQTRLKFCGNEDRLDYILDRFGDRVIRQSGVRPEHWPLVISTFDIGLAPLDTRPLDPPWREGAPVVAYDERRSWLKAVEYLCAGVPWVASRSATYDDLRRYGTVVENTADGWFGALDYAVRNLSERKAEAWHRRKWAMRQLTFESNIDQYGKIFERIAGLKAAKRKAATLPGVTYVTQKERVTA